ncbi:MAG: hypothetical protein RBS73_05025 [Prolixibacteraceae bacterium]|jgi:hypothetical protein|nr:hypothetical protein [Prolixibacteraceae bacterium]
MPKFIKNLQKQEVWPCKGKGNPVRKGQGLIFEPDGANLPQLDQGLFAPGEAKARTGRSIPFKKAF